MNPEIDLISRLKATEQDNRIVKNDDYRLNSDYDDSSVFKFQSHPSTWLGTEPKYIFDRTVRYFINTQEYPRIYPWGCVVACSRERVTLSIISSEFFVNHLENTGLKRHKKRAVRGVHGISEDA